MSKLNLDRIFTYQRPFGTQQERYVALRDAAKAFAELIIQNSPASREQSLAITAVQQATMWVNAAIAVNEVEPKVVVAEAGATV